MSQKITQKLLKKKMKQKLVKLGAKISVFGSVFKAQRYRNNSDHFSFVSTHSIFTRLGDSVKA